MPKLQTWSCDTSWRAIILARNSTGVCSTSWKVTQRFQLCWFLYGFLTASFGSFECVNCKFERNEASSQSTARLREMQHRTLLRYSFQPQLVVCSTALTFTATEIHLVALNYRGRSVQGWKNVHFGTRKTTGALLINTTIQGILCNCTFTEKRCLKGLRTLMIPFSFTSSALKQIQLLDVRMTYIFKHPAFSSMLE